MITSGDSALMVLTDGDDGTFTGAVFPDAVPTGTQVEWQGLLDGLLAGSVPYRDPSTLTGYYTCEYLPDGGIVVSKIKQDKSGRGALDTMSPLSAETFALIAFLNDPVNELVSGVFAATERASNDPVAPLPIRLGAQADYNGNLVPRHDMTGPALRRLSWLGNVLLLRLDIR